MTRYAIVVNADTERQLAAYMPDNYRVVSFELDPATGKPVGWIAGDDYCGWTLDDYVIPRLGSGLIWATEIPAEVVPDDVAARAVL